jgi:hypothetical protein
MKKLLLIRTLPLFAKGWYIGGSAGPEICSERTSVAASINCGHSWTSYRLDGELGYFGALDTSYLMVNGAITLPRVYLGGGVGTTFIYGDIYQLFIGTDFSLAPRTQLFLEYRAVFHEYVSHNPRAGIRFCF